jgi:hypothetical protein
MNYISLIKNIPVRTGVVIIVSTILMKNLAMNFSVDPYRTEGPKWNIELENKAVICNSVSSKKSSIFLTFYPNWPTNNPHVYGLSEPTTNEISCEKLLSKL